MTGRLECLCWDTYSAQCPLVIAPYACHIEDAETLAKLGEMGVDCVQGYLIGEPRTLESLA